MIDSIGRRLCVAFGDAADDVPSVDAPSDPTAVSLSDVEFVAYGEDCLLSGRVRLDADRLSDMLNDHDEILLVDVRVEPLAELHGQPVVVDEVLVPRAELLLVHASGPRGDASRRHRTRLHAVGLRVGPYDVRGYLHGAPFSDPLLAIRRRGSMIPLTDASVAFEMGGLEQRRRGGTIVVNRDRIDLVVPIGEDELRIADRPLEASRALLV